MTLAGASGSFWPNPCSSRDTQHRGPRAISRQLIKISKETPQSLYASLPYSKEVLPGGQREPPVFVCVHCLLFWHWAPLNRAWLHPLVTLPSGRSLQDTDEIPDEPPLLQDEQIWLSQPPLTGWLLPRSLIIFTAIHCTLSPQHIQISLVLGSSELDTALQVWAHQC